MVRSPLRFNLSWELVAHFSGASWKRSGRSGDRGRHIRLCRFPVRFSGLQTRLAHPPKTGADTAAVLRELGMDDKDIAALRDGGVIG